MIYLKPEYAAKAIRKFLIDANGPNHRYRSWDHCYLAFKNARKQKSEATGNDVAKDLLCLHLSCYLSSWGMMRNSFLLDRDYRTHHEIVRILFEQQYEKLWTFPAKQDAIHDTETLKDHWKMIANIRKDFEKEYKEGRDKANPNQKGLDPITETLTTKILLGTCGCIPANDRMYKAAVGAFGGTQRLGLKSYSTVMSYYWSNWSEISSHLEGTSLVIQDDPATPYPPMKLMDMCFWQIGSCIESYDKNYYNEKDKTGKRFVDMKGDPEMQHLALGEFLI